MPVHIKVWTRERVKSLVDPHLLTLSLTLFPNESRAWHSEASLQSSL